MTTESQAHRVRVNEPIVLGRRYDYADEYEVHGPEVEPCPPEDWVAAGLDATPKWVGRVVKLLGVDASDASGGGIGGWDIIESTPDVIHLEQSLPLIQVVFVGRNVEPTHRTLTTALTYDRPLIGRLVWSVIGIAHRRTARRLITAVPDGAPAPGDVRR